MAGGIHELTPLDWPRMSCRSPAGKMPDGLTVCLAAACTTSDIITIDKYEAPGTPLQAQIKVATSMECWTACENYRGSQVCKASVISGPKDDKCNIYASDSLVSKIGKQATRCMTGEPSTGPLKISKVIGDHAGAGRVRKNRPWSRDLARIYFKPADCCNVASALALDLQICNPKWQHL